MWGVIFPSFSDTVLLYVIVNCSHRKIIGADWFPLFFNYYTDTQVDTHRLILRVSFSPTHSLACTGMQNPRTVFTITYHYAVREVKIMLPIKVIWLSFAHHWASIYISSYICFECHWAVPWSSTLNPTGNVHDSFLLPATLTIPEMSSLISLGYRLPCHYSPSHSTSIRLESIFFFFSKCVIVFIPFLLCLLSSMQWIRGFPPVQVNVFIM